MRSGRQEGRIQGEGRKQEEVMRSMKGIGEVHEVECLKNAEGEK